MKTRCQYRKVSNSYSLEDVLSDEIRHIIQRSIQEGRASIQEGYIWRNCASSPEFVIACEIAEQTGLSVTA